MVTSTKAPITEHREEEQVEQCRHHWVIEAASGPTSNGKCRLCGAQKEFRNYLENASWGDNDTSATRDPADLVAASLGSTEPEEES